MPAALRAASRAAVVASLPGRGLPLARHFGKRSSVSSKSAAPSATSCRSYWTSPAWYFIKSGGAWGGFGHGFSFGLGPGPGPGLGLGLGLGLAGAGWGWG